MQDIKDILSLKQNKKKERPVQYWQELALEIIEFTGVSYNQRGSIFKTCQQDIHRAQRSFTTCKELNKPFIKYYFKVFNELNKQ